MATIEKTHEEMVVGILDSILLHCFSRDSSSVRGPYRSLHVLEGTNANIHSFYVGIPRFANDYINNHQLDYEGFAITNPRPNSFHVSQSQKLSMGGGFTGSGHLTAFNASIRVPATNEEFAVLPLPQIDFDNGVNLNIDQDLVLSCVDCLSKVAVAAVTNESFGVLVTGNPDLKLGALPTAHLNIHKTLNMNGKIWASFFLSELGRLMLTD